MAIAYTDHGWDAPLNEVLRYFEIPGRHIFVLGSFARHATLYSQQVRALNLITALADRGDIREGRRLAVVGAGASGLMAAAAAAYHKAQVTVFDRNRSPMSLQQGSTHRWLHPRLQDWPAQSTLDDRADLPLMPWSAGYASEVAASIVSRWNSIKTTLKIDESLQSRVRGMKDKADKVELEWTDAGNRQQTGEFDLVILAVGYGIESEVHPWQWSYWRDDGLSQEFHGLESTERVLISGAGDGGLVDLMRLCFQDFKHEIVADLASKVDPIVGEKLLKLHQSGAKPKHIHDQFRSILMRHGILREKGGPSEEWKNHLIEQGLREHSTRKITLSDCRGEWFGPGSSILNRFIVALLEGHAFEFVGGNADARSYTIAKKYSVKLGEKKPVPFDRVIERHGPKPALDSFEELATGCKFLRQVWAAVDPYADPTRVRLWDDTCYRLPSQGREPGHDLRRTHPGPSVESLNIWKDVLEDGSCSLTYWVDGLTAGGETLERVSFSYFTPSGTVGSPQLDRDAMRLGIMWVPATISPGPSPSLDATLDRVHRVDGYFKLSTPLTASSKPLRFGFRLSIMNSHARTQWERQQMASLKTSRKTGDIYDPEWEVFTRSIWFPVTRLKITLSLPRTIATEPVRCGFESRRGRKSKPEAGVLSLSPSFDQTRGWVPMEAEKMENYPIDKPSRSCWVLDVRNPKIGTSYGFSWRVSAGSDESNSELRSRTNGLREILLAHAKSQGDSHRVARALQQLARSLSRVRSVREKLNVDVMVYDEVRKCLVLVAAHLNDTLHSDFPSPFNLPYGLGLAGACFRDGRNAFIFHPAGVGGAIEKAHHSSDSDSALPRVYLPLPWGRSHEILLAFPMCLPEMAQVLASEVPMLEPARYCVAVVCVGSDRPRSGLAVQIEQNGIVWVQRACNRFVKVLSAIAEEHVPVELIPGKDASAL